MKQCPYCGSELTDEARFCVECGRSLEGDAPAAEPVEEPTVTEEPAPAAEPEPAPVTPAPVPVVVAAPEQKDEPQDDAPTITQMPSRKQMLSTFQYIVLSLLYGIPVIGLVFLFVFGAGHPKNVSLKRFSAAMLILRLLFWIVLLGLLIVTMVRNGRLLSDALGQLIPAVERLFEAMFA